jgi:hypothetical protein
MRKENAELQKVVKAATEQKRRKRKYVRTGDTFTAGEVLNLVAPLDVDGEREGEKPAKKVQGKRHCGRCGKTRHNTNICKVDTKNAVDDDKSE